jgi:hypothetical protein
VGFCPALNLHLRARAWCLKVCTLTRVQLCQTRCTWRVSCCCRNWQGLQSASSVAPAECCACASENGREGGGEGGDFLNPELKLNLNLNLNLNPKLPWCLRCPMRSHPSFRWGPHLKSGDRALQRRYRENL